MHKLLAGTCLVLQLLPGAAAMANFPGQDPDWPCAQLLVPTLTPGTYWRGPAAANTAWRDDEKLFATVTDIVDRDTGDTEALAKLDAYADAIPADQRTVAIPALFGAIVDQTNDERTLLIQRIKQLGLRQRKMGDVVAAISSKVDSTPATDPKHDELAGERDFDVRAFQETQHTMRYACEAPATVERRLGAFARALQAKLPQK